MGREVAAVLPLLAAMDHLQPQAMAAQALHQQLLDQASRTAVVAVAVPLALAVLADPVVAVVAHPVGMAQTQLRILVVAVVDLAPARLGLAALAAPASSS
jgi:hypothetical protein